MCTRVRVYDWGKQDTGPAHDRHTNGTQDHRQESNHKQREKPAYIGIIAGNEKKV